MVLIQETATTASLQAITGVIALHMGHYEVTWDASGFGNGIYFYRLEAGEFIEIKRMALIR